MDDYRERDRTVEAIERLTASLEEMNQIRAVQISDLMTELVQISRLLSSISSTLMVGFAALVLWAIFR